MKRDSDSLKNRYGLECSTPDGTPDGVSLGMLDWTSLRPDVGPSDGLGDGSEDSRPLETTYGPSLGLPNGKNRFEILK